MLITAKNESEFPLLLFLIQYFYLFGLAELKNVFVNNNHNMLKALTIQLLP